MKVLGGYGWKSFFTCWGDDEGSQLETKVLSLSKCVHSKRYCWVNVTGITISFGSAAILSRQPLRFAEIFGSIGMAASSIYEKKEVNGDKEVLVCLRSSTFGHHFAWPFAWGERFSRAWN
jgi:hypothetical protein